MENVECIALIHPFARFARAGDKWHVIDAVVGEGGETVYMVYCSNCARPLHVGCDFCIVRGATSGRRERPMSREEALAAAAAMAPRLATIAAGLLGAALDNAEGGAEQPPRHADPDTARALLEGGLLEARERLRQHGPQLFEWARALPEMYAEFPRFRAPLGVAQQRAVREAIDWGARRKGKENIWLQGLDALSRFMGAPLLGEVLPAGAGGLTKFAGRLGGFAP